MKISGEKINFFARIILPTLLAFLLFSIAIFVIIIPNVEQNLLDKKRELIKELTNSSWSILNNLNEEVNNGNISIEKAKEEAIGIIEHLRYGSERKDYFWITDFHPNMIIHPYRTDLNNTDLSDYRDPHGKKLFVEFVKVVKTEGEGFVDYMWQWKDDTTRIVPKLSYVKSFTPWSWIIGTGIYIEDVKEEIASLTGSLVYISLGILLVLGLILAYISTSSLRIEKSRQKIYTALQESEARYKLLVEASTEGLVLFLDSKFVYANQTLLKMLGYNKDINLEDILCDWKKDATSGAEYFRKLKNNEVVNNKFEAQLRKKDGSLLNVILYSSDITLNQSKGYSIIVRDVTYNLESGTELSEINQNISSLLNSNQMGLFRTTLGRNGRFIDVNNSVLEILSYKDKNELFQKNLFDFFPDSIRRKELFQKLADEKKLKDFIINIKRKDNKVFTSSVTATIVEDENGEPKYCDGIIEDVTQRKIVQDERENIIQDLQNSLRMLNEPVKYFIQEIKSCDMNLSIEHVAKIMTEKNCDAILLQTAHSNYIGIITDKDLRKRAIADKLDLSKPIHTIMSAPIISIGENDSVLNALYILQKKKIEHIVVKKISREILGFISLSNLLEAISNSMNYILFEIEKVKTKNDLIQIKNKIPRIIKSLIDGGARIKNTTKTITDIFNALAIKITNLAIEELGPPPVDFAFIALGSAGRNELMLTSDQDNALIYENVKPEIEPEVKKYFDKLSMKICDGLNECGYDYCNGEAMAKNPRWTQSLSTWKNNFHTWIVNSNPQDLIDLSIFFDFRCVVGKCELADELRNYIFIISEGQAGFYQHLAKNCLQHKPPVGFLGKIVLESKGEHPETFDIKNATVPIVDFSRLHSLKNKIANTNTFERLEELNRIGILNKSSYEELLDAYRTLTKFRFRHHSAAISSGLEPNNFINPSQLTELEITTLKSIFSYLVALQKKLSYDFSGDAL
ncbi:MAG: cache domain-containing protein [Ignavibacteriales bacterium]|nr:cache domain-containing protein [Ignavibacteriales bacterium]